MTSINCEHPEAGQEPRINSLHSTFTISFPDAISETFELAIDPEHDQTKFETAEREEL